MKFNIPDEEESNDQDQKISDKPFTFGGQDSNNEK